MKMRKSLFALSAAALLAALLGNTTFAGCGTCDKTVVEVAVQEKGFETLVAAVKAADLVKTLSGKGPFTVFAPTDEAFAKLPKETLKDLLKPENKSKLAAILTYHVVPSKAIAKDVVRLYGGRLTFSRSPDLGGLRVEASLPLRPPA